MSQDVLMVGTRGDTVRLRLVIAETGEARDINLTADEARCAMRRLLRR